MNELPTPDNQLQVANMPHYTYQVQMLIDMYNANKLPEVKSITVEPKYGYVASINYTNDTSRIIYGHDPGFNPGSSEQLAKDKGYTKFILRNLGIDCPEGDEFLLPWWAETLGQSERHRENQHIQTTDDAHTYIQESLQYPVYVKPTSGSQGSGVKKIYDQTELVDAFSEYNTERVKVALVEQALTMPDYRLLVFDGELVNAYERQPLSISGDGENDIASLIADLDKAYKLNGREIHLAERMQHITHHLGRVGLDMTTVLSPLQKVNLIEISNLSAGGVPIDVTESLHPRWVDIANRIAKGFNLRICGVDLACTDITSNTSDYSVIEVNATPGARHFMASGEEGRAKLEQLFMNLFRTSTE